MNAAETYGAKRPVLMLVILVLVYVIYAIDRTTPVIIAEEVKKEFALSDGQLGLFTGLAYGLSFGVVGLLSGPAIDRFNRSHMLAGMLVMWSGLTALGAVAGAFWQLLLLRFAVGAAEAGGSPTALAILSDIFPPSRRGVALGVYKIGTPIGFFAASVGAGFIASRYGWRAALLMAGLPGMVLAVAVFIFVLDPVRGALDHASSEAVRPLGARQILALVSGGSGLGLLTTGLVLYTCANMGLQAFIMPFFSRIHHASLAQAGFFYGMASALGGISPIIMGLVNDQVSKKGIERSSYLATSIALVTTVAGAGMVLSDPLAGSVIALFAWQMLVVSMSVVNFATALAITPPGGRGTVMAILLVGSISVGAGAGPVIMGYLSDALGGGVAIRPAALILITLNLAAAAAYFLSGRALAAKPVQAGDDRADLARGDPFTPPAREQS